MDFLSTVTFIVLAWVLAYALSVAVGTIKNRHRKLPPGPFPWPVVGNIFSVGDEPHKSLADLAKRYGPIMKLKLGNRTTVVISSSGMAKLALQKHDLVFSNRTIPNAVRAHDHHKYSVVWAPGSSTTWRTIRKIMISNIFTVQKLDSSLQQRHLKVQELISDLQKSSRAGNSVDIGEAVFRSTLNLLSNAIFSMDLADSDSGVASEFKKLMWNVSMEAGKPNLVDCFPVLKVIDPQGIRSRLTIHFGKIIALFGEIINKRLESRALEGNNTGNDVLDTLLDIIKDNNEIDRNHIEHMLLDLFTAGVDTTANTVEWAMTEVLRNPRTLLKAQDELKQNVGSGKPIEESDIIRLPYLQAIVKETFRLHPTVPLLLPHKADAEVEVCGFTVPKDAELLVNVWAIGRDSNTWENPDLFLPERFLGSKIDIKGQDFELIPFGAGRRVCPGMPLGIRMVYLMLGSLINSFEWKLEDGLTPDMISLEEKFGITLQKAQPLHAIALPC